MTDLQTRFEAAFTKMPLIAILRGITPPEAEAVAEVLIDAGFTLIEVPLNSPQPFDSIERIIRTAAGRALVGAGTVTETSQVLELKRIGAEMVISPHTDLDVVRATVSAGMLSFPGCMTPSECFAAIRNGACALKLFPTEVIGPSGVKAMRAVLPKDIRLIAVGGVSPQTIPTLRDAGCNGFGIGSALYKPGMTPADVAGAAKAFVAVA